MVNTLKQLFISMIVVSVFIQLPLHAQIMITEDSMLLDTNGEIVSNVDFIESMNSGTFTAESIADDHGNVIGYRLVPNKPNNSIQSETQPFFEIDTPVAIPIVYEGLFLVRAKIKGSQRTIEGWLIVDTGTFVPLILLPEGLQKLGKVASLHIGQLEVTQPLTGSYERPDIIRSHGKSFKKKVPNRLDELEVIGILGGTAFSGNSYTLDLKNEELIVYPGSVEQGLTTKDIGVAYRDEENNIWIPVSIGLQNGYAHLDTGYHTSWIDSSADQSDQSVLIGETVFITSEDIHQIDVLDQSKNFNGVGVRVIMGIGNDILEDFKVTVDTVQANISFENIAE